MKVTFFVGRSKNWQETAFVLTGELLGTFFTVEVESEEMSREERAMLLPFVNLNSSFFHVHVQKEAGKYVEFDETPTTKQMLTALAEEYRKVGKLPNKLGNIKDEAKIKDFWTIWFAEHYVAAYFIFSQINGASGKQ